MTAKSPTNRLLEAVDELYGAQAEVFMARRKALGAAARSDGDKTAATQIVALRKPTKSAYAVNMLIRNDDSAGPELTQLAKQLRQGERSVDADVLRDLADRRRNLVADLTDRAFAIIGEDSPTPALREEVSSTLKAGLADQRVAQQILEARLIRSVEWDGFGFSSRPDLSVVLPDSAAPAATGDSERSQTSPPKKSTSGDSELTRRREQKVSAKLRAARESPAEKTSEEIAAEATAEKERAEKQRVAAEQEQLRKRQAEAVAEAEKDLEAAEEQVADTARSVIDAKQVVEQLTEQLNDAQLDLDEAEAAAKTAEVAHRRAVQALKRSRIIETP